MLPAHKQSILETMIIYCNTAARLRLKSATASVPMFSNVRLLSGLEEAAVVLEHSAMTDVIFIAHRFEHLNVKRFIGKAKEIEASRDAAFVLLIDQDGQEGGSVAQQMLIGADGFLLEPYSVDNLVEITRLAGKVKKDRSTQREAVAYKLVLADVMQQLDRIAYLKSSSFDTTAALKRLKELCTAFEGLSEESRQVYLEVAMQEFPQAKLTTFPARNYAGVSSRVKKRMEAKVLETFEAQTSKAKGEESA